MFVEAKVIPPRNLYVFAHVNLLLHNYVLYEHIPLDVNICMVKSYFTF